jgi:pSer/pThr/pTyr-binding forkhead associated (FHA) protein
VAGDDLTLEIVEGPGAGQQLALARPVVLGRAADADLVLADGEVSRHHARVSPAPEGYAIVEDLGSANGTFVNQNEVEGAARIDPGDELLLGVTLMQVRSRQQVADQPSAVRAVPPPLATTPRAPDYVNPELLRAEAAPRQPSPGSPALEKYLDTRVRRRAQLAPLAMFVLVALALIIYFALH